MELVEHRSDVGPSSAGPARMLRVEVDTGHPLQDSPGQGRSVRPGGALDVVARDSKQSGEG